MIDYLALLLEEQEQEETAEPSDWTVLLQKNGAEYAGEAGKANASMADAGALDRNGAAAGAGRENGTERAAEEKTAETAPGFVKSLFGMPVGAGGNPPAGTKRNRGAEHLYQQMRRSRVQAGYTRPVAAEQLLTRPTGETEPWETGPEGLDRLFRRDARRYDGGFTLF